MYDLFLNKQKEKENFIASVVELNPLMVELIPGDTPIPAVETSNLFGIGIGSRVLLKRIGKQFIVTNVIGSNIYPRFISKAGNQNINNTTAFANLTGMFADFKAGGTYSIDVYIMCRNETSATPNIKTDWAVDGTVSNLTGKNCKGGLAISVSNLTGTVQRSSGAHGFGTAIFYNVDALNVTQFNWEHAVFTATTDATIQIRAAQATAHASNTIISSYSHIIVNEMKG